MHIKRLWQNGCMVAATVFLFFSCTTRSTLRFEKLSESTLNNNFLPAIAAIKKHPELYGKNSLFLYHMDLGTLYHYAGLFDSSTGHLQKAADIFDNLFSRSITNEATAIMTNDNIRPYRSKPYELVMLHQFLASNYLVLDKIDDALVETRRVQLFFNEWNRKDRSGLKYDSDGMFHYLSSIAYDAAGETSDAMISLFHAVKAFQAGPVALPEQVRDRAYHMFKLNGRENDNSLLNLSPGATQDQRAGLQNGMSEIVVVGYVGRGPAFTEEKWWGTWVKDGLLVVHHTGPDGRQQTMTLPAPALPPGELRKAERGQTTQSGTTFHIKFALPAVSALPSTTKDFMARCSGQPDYVPSIIINDLDQQAKKYLNDTRGVLIARTVARVVLRTIAAQAAKKQMQTSSTAANLLINIGTDLLADQLEKADIRSCFLLPKTVQIVRLPVTPGTYSIEVVQRGDNGIPLNTEYFSGIKVGRGQKKFIICQSFK